MSKGLKIVLGIFAAFVLLIIVVAISVIGIYNRLNTANQAVQAGWSQVENVYQRRMDLIPNLVATVKGYAKHEESTLREVTEARAKVGEMDVSKLANNPAAQKQFLDAQGGLTSALNHLMVVQEKYPDLKANENFLSLQNQLEGTENRIAVERKNFVDAVNAYNTTRSSFPTILLAGILGFQQHEYYTADQGASKAPTVQF